MHIPLMFGYLLNTKQYFKYFFFSILTANLWLSKTLHFGENDSQCHLNGTHVLHLDGSQKGNCEMFAPGKLYPSFFLVATHMFVGQILLICFVEKIGRRVTLSRY